MVPLTWLAATFVPLSSSAMASRGRCGGVPARDDEQRHEERAEQQAPAPQGPVLPPPPPVDYGVFMQGLVQAMQTQAHTPGSTPGPVGGPAGSRPSSGPWWTLHHGAIQEDDPT
ncbi:hypothetical protein Taro_000947, partial [Colocasia esculenta]|nr:hypothetical protein [Colocasia esculenta]